MVKTGYTEEGGEKKPASKLIINEKQYLTGDRRHLQTMWAKILVCRPFAQNVGLFAANVGSKHTLFAVNVVSNNLLFAGPCRFVCGPLQLWAGTGCR
ncbi:MAG: hypothetical protein R3F37_23945, partial [Candidatus Competibacteraceae bacterium]